MESWTRREAGSRQRTVVFRAAIAFPMLSHNIAITTPSSGAPLNFLWQLFHEIPKLDVQL